MMINKYSEHIEPSPTDFLKDVKQTLIEKYDLSIEIKIIETAIVGNKKPRRLVIHIKNNKEIEVTKSIKRFLGSYWHIGHESYHDCLIIFYCDNITEANRDWYLKRIVYES